MTTRAFMNRKPQAPSTDFEEHRYQVSKRIVYAPRIAFVSFLLSGCTNTSSNNERIAWLSGILARSKLIMSSRVSITFVVSNPAVTPKPLYFDSTNPVLITTRPLKGPSPNVGSVYFVKGQRNG
ncbi:hypothetical protein WG66_009820 [Moniliophthora roreri]|nr:hypothetical protein WG66_009820 [Moniliophthora roreri]